MERLPRLTQVKVPAKEKVHTPENYSREALELKEKMLMSFLKTTALSPQNFVLQQVSAVGVIIEAKEKGFSAETVFTSITEEEKEIIGLRLEQARDRLHSAHGVAKRNNPSNGPDMFNKLYNAHTVQSAITMERVVSRMGLISEEIKSLVEMIMTYFYENKDRFDEFKNNASGEEEEKVQAELWIQDFVGELRNELLISEIGKKVSTRLTPAIFFQIMHILLPKEIYLG